MSNNQTTVFWFCIYRYRYCISKLKFAELLCAQIIKIFCTSDIAWVLTQLRVNAYR